jgi:hypothetical protein
LSSCSCPLFGVDAVGTSVVEDANGHNGAVLL